MVKGLAKCGRVIARLPYNSRFEQQQRQAAQRIADDLRRYQILVISGPDRHDFKANCRIGKTTLVRSQLIPELERRNLAVQYINLQELADPESVTFFGKINARFAEKIASLAEADVYIFDDLQYIFPRVDVIEGGASSFMRFWQKVDELKAAGKEIVFITSAHPEERYFNDFKYRSASASFLTAHVIELIRRRT